MQKCGVVDVERDLADARERVFAPLVLKNAHVLRHQPAERVEREPADVGFDAVFVQFLSDTRAPFATESLFGKVPTSGDKGGERQHNGEPNGAADQATRKGGLSILRSARGNFW